MTSLYVEIYNMIYNDFLQGAGTPPDWNVDMLSYLLTTILMILLFIAVIKISLGAVAWVFDRFSLM